ncbi:hypothetical protein [Rickettsia australis]|nr:hypothetical protein [Rickettsia australis]
MQVKQMNLKYIDLLLNSFLLDSIRESTNYMLSLFLDFTNT